MRSNRPDTQHHKTDQPVRPRSQSVRFRPASVNQENHTRVGKQISQPIRQTQQLIDLHHVDKINNISIDLIQVDKFNKHIKINVCCD
eukprot:UN25621